MNKKLINKIWRNNILRATFAWLFLLCKKTSNSLLESLERSRLIVAVAGLLRNIFTIFCPFLTMDKKSSWGNISTVCIIKI